MGLDVYLTHYKDEPEEVLAAESAYSDGADKNWVEVAAGRRFEELTEGDMGLVAQKNDDLAFNLGLLKGGESPGKEDIRLGPTNQPNGHLFKIGYFRSSYNEGGYNSVCRRLFGHSGLYEVFAESESGKYDLQVDWVAAKERAALQVVQWSEFLQNGEQLFDVLSVDAEPMFGRRENINSPNGALEAFCVQLERRNELLRTFLESNPGATEESHPYAYPCGEYTNAVGQFYLGEPLKVYGIIPGVRERFGAEVPVTNVIYGVDRESYRWYLQSIEIVLETCNYVLSQPDPERHWLRWSA